MPRQIRGTTYPVKGGLGILWQHNGTRQRNPGPFRNKTEAHRWFDEHVAPDLRRGAGPRPDVTFDRFCDDYLSRWGAEVAPRTRASVAEWLTPARQKFGNWTLAELEGAADDIARWRSRIPTDDRRHKNTRAIRQVLEAARRWGYIARNPAKDMGANPQPRSDEVQPFTREELAAVAAELADSPRDVAIVVFAAQTGLRTNEWVALERRDIDRRGQVPIVSVARRFAHGQPTPYPKTGRRAVPLTPEALAAVDGMVARIDTPVLFPGRFGEPLNLNNWANRTWTPALKAAGVEQRGPYHLRHTFATEALAAGVSIFQLSRLMGASVSTIDRAYAHYASDSLDDIHGLLTNRSAALSGKSDA